MGWVVVADGDRSSITQGCWLSCSKGVWGGRWRGDHAGGVQPSCRKVTEEVKISGWRVAARELGHASIVELREW